MMSTKPTILLTAYERGQVEKVKAYVDDHLDADLRADELALLYDVSVYKLKAGFVQQYGQRLAVYVKSRRMQKAKELLLTTNKLLFEIALACGYRNVPAFSRAFKQYYLQAPDAFRRGEW